MPHDDMKYRDLPPEPSSLKYPQGLREINFAPSTFETIDYAIYDYMNDEFDFHVTTNKGFEKVPVVWVASERSYQIKDKKELRDDEGAIIMPIITIERTSVAKKLNVKGSYYGGQFINKDEKGGGLLLQDESNKRKLLNSTMQTKTENTPRLKVKLEQDQSLFAEQTKEKLYMKPFLYRQ